MIIACNSCSAQYSVSDAKVRGKLVRITCKHCSSAIVVDGRQMTDAQVASQKPVSGYALPRRDESVVAAMPNSLRQGPASAPRHAPVSAPVHSPPVSAPTHSVMSAALREEDQTMVARSRFGDDMSVHDERTVIGQIPKEALEFERMFAQRTQPPPPEPAGAPASTSPPPGNPMPAGPLPTFASSSAPPPRSEASDTRESSGASDPSEPPDSSDSSESREDAEDEAERNSQQGFSRSEPPTVGNQPTSDVRGLVSQAEATHPSVVRSVKERRLRVTLVTILVLAVLVLLFMYQKPH